MPPPCDISTTRFVVYESQVGELHLIAFVFKTPEPESVTRDQCDTRPTVTFPGKEHCHYIPLDWYSFPIHLRLGG